MDLEKYIKENRKGIEANKIEKQSFADSFLSEALEGYDLISGDHSAGIDAIKNRLSSDRTQVLAKKGPILSIFIVAALVAASLVLLFVVPYFNNTKSLGNADVLYVEANAVQPINVYLPNTFSLTMGDSRLIYQNGSDLSVMIVNDDWIDEDPALREAKVVINVYLPADY